MHICLNIAGYRIHIEFGDTEWPEKRVRFIENIHTYFSGFQVNVGGVYDVLIKVKEIKGIPYIESQGLQYSRYYEKRGEKRYETYYHISAYELSQLLQIIIINLLGTQGFVLHASAVLTDKGVVIFAGPSGTGKSTILHTLSLSLLPLADDSIILKKENNAYMCYQSPNIDKEGTNIKKNTKPNPLHQIYKLKKNSKLQVAYMSSIRALKFVTRSLWTVEKTNKTQFVSVINFINTNKRVQILSWQLKDKNKVRQMFI